MSAKPTPKADALRALREREANEPAPIPIDDDITVRIGALLIRARYRLNTMPDPSNPSPDDVLIHDLARMLAAAVSEED